MTMDTERLANLRLRAEQGDILCLHEHTMHRMDDTPDMWITCEDPAGQVVLGRLTLDPSVDTDRWVASITASHVQAVACRVVLELLGAAEWVVEERGRLWRDFGQATKRAIHPPNADDPKTWSGEMLNLEGRILKADAALGGPTPWEVLTWDVFRFYPAVEGVALPDEAWAWLERWISSQLDGDAMEAPRRVLHHRPAPAQ